MHLKVIDNNRINYVATFAKRKWLDREIDYLYSQRSFWEVEADCLFEPLKFQLNNFEQWLSFQGNMVLAIEEDVKKLIS